jgi:hypothetical protein
MDIDSSLDLEPGDFLYQSDSELFLVVIEERDNSYFMAAHGWREIDKERLGEYVDGENGRLHRSEEVEETLDEKGDDETIENYQRLLDLFEMYTGDIEDSGPHEDFALEDT